MCPVASQVARKGGVGTILLIFDTGARWDGWSVSLPGHFTLGKEAKVHRTGRWVGLRAGLDEPKNCRPTGV